MDMTALLQANGDKEEAAKMAAYMQNRFVFAGIPKPRLSELMKPFWKETAKTPLDRSFVKALWQNKYREAQYVALEYVKRHIKELLPSDLGFLKELIIEKSWWETVDTLDAMVGEIVKKEKSLTREMLKWAESDNMWLRRTAIDFQQTYKSETDKELLAAIIEKNLGGKEFFINKAIGWSLRDYGKVNPTWVKDFVAAHRERMAPLSVKEALKLIEK